MMNFFKKNLLQKIIALVVAIGCWFFVMNDQNPQIENTYTVPITVLNLPSGYAVSKDTEQAKITVKAPRTLFSSLDPNSIKVFIDLNHVDTGTHDLQLQTVLPSGFELISVEPGKITVNVERIEEKTVPVKINISGAPGDGKVVAKTNLSMQNVKVQGPTSIINEVTGVIGFLNVAGNSTDNTFDVNLVAVNDENQEISGVKILPGSIEVGVTFAKGLNTKIVDVKPTVKGDLPDNYILKSYSIDPDKIEISGQDNVLSSVSYVPTQQIPLANITKPTTLSVKLDVPKDISAPDVTVKVYIDVEPKQKAASDNSAEKNKT